MKVVLLQDIKGSGKKNDVINVSDGYARNYLFPRKLAKEATESALAEVASLNSAKAHKEKLELDAAKAAAAQIDKKELHITAKCGASGKLFGAITSKEISAAISENFGTEIDKKKIVLKGDIKSVGEYDVAVKFYPNVAAEIKVIVTE